MSENNKSSANDNKPCDPDTQASSENILWNIEETTPILAYDKQQFLIEKANTTFQELYKSLESEQTKLSELETKRKNLQKEMLRLRSEIEEEKESLNVNIVRSVTENLNALNNGNSINLHVSDQSQPECETLKFDTLNACYEVQEHILVTTREGTIEEDVQYIRSELQNVLTQCISEQCDEKY